MEDKSYSLKNDEVEIYNSTGSNEIRTLFFTKLGVSHTVFLNGLPGIDDTIQIDKDVEDMFREYNNHMEILPYSTNRPEIKFSTIQKKPCGKILNNLIYGTTLPGNNGVTEEPIGGGYENSHLVTLVNKN
jgi:hypothetical protein